MSLLYPRPYSSYYDYPYYSRYSAYSPYYADPYYSPYSRYPSPYYSRYYDSPYAYPARASTSYVSYDSPSKTEIKDVSPGKVTTTTVDKSPVSPALDRTTTTTTYTDPYPAYPYHSRYYPSYRYGSYDRYWDSYYHPYASGRYPYWY